jgi:hypothetical protein
MQIAAIASAPLTQLGTTDMSFKSKISLAWKLKMASWWSKFDRI